MKQAVIFDMDGVIIDSNPYHKIAWERFFEKKGILVDDELFNNVISGKTGGTTLRILLGQELTDEEITKYLKVIDGGFQEIFSKAEGVEPVSGIPEFIAGTRECGYKTALATSAPPRNVELILEKLNLQESFDLIIDKTNVINGKPDPEVYLTTVKHLEIPGDNCIVFEDSLSGIRSALGAGLRVIGVTTTHNKKELLESGVSMVIDDFKNLHIEELFNLSQ